jgi:hypothetical protein
LGADNTFRLSGLKYTFCAVPPEPIAPLLFLKKRSNAVELDFAPTQSYLYLEMDGWMREDEEKKKHRHLNI